jgi:hypothetical protein
MLIYRVSSISLGPLLHITVGAICGIGVAPAVIALGSGLGSRVVGSFAIGALIILAIAAGHLRSRNCLIVLWSINVSVIILLLLSWLGQVKG